MRSFYFTLVIFLLTRLCSGQAATGIARPTRHALILGNGNYESLPKIPIAAREAELVKEALKKSGFDVMEATDFRYPDLAQITEPAFLAGVRQGDLCFVYFSGYSVQAFEDTFLLPVNFDPKAKDDAVQRGYSLTRLLQSLDNKKAGVKIVSLEASRGISAPIENVRSAGPAPADLSELRQYLFASAAPPSSTLNQPEGVLGAFTVAVAEGIVKPGLNVNKMFLEVQRDVALRSALQQTPYVVSNVTTEIILVPAPVVVVTPAKPTLPLGLPASNRRDREEYVWIPGGTFLMGCVKGDAKCEKDEKPQHSVTIGHGLWMGRNEVQVGSYRRFVRAKNVKMPTPPIWGRGKWDPDDHPIVNVSWQDANSYCSWVGGRLPTEAEWEYAARANRPNKIYPMDSLEESRDKANFNGKGLNDDWEHTAPVRKFDPNPFKLYDMAGNVWEWVSDWYRDGYSEVPLRDPAGPPSGKQNVARGGSFDSDPKTHLRISIRKPFNKPANNIGLRCVMDDAPETQNILLGVK